MQPDNLHPGPSQSLLPGLLVAAEMPVPSPLPALPTFRLDPQIVDLLDQARRELSARLRAQYAGDDESENPRSRGVIYSSAKSKAARSTFEGVDMLGRS